MTTSVKAGTPHPQPLSPSDGERVASDWPKGFVVYPNFKSLGDEVGWLQIQYSRLCGEVAFLSSLRRLQYDVSENLVKVKDMYKHKLEEVTQERDFFMAEVARLASHDPKHKYRTSAESEHAAAATHAAFPKGRWAPKTQGGLG